ncbi:MAG TPA: hypothetical protein VL282_01935 [Tepidisphaeraceae bacterium]|jgi:hypothetical protein|nr:hypothetical protein [Tepidisphaeraceae bacterium]
MSKAKQKTKPIPVAKKPVDPEVAKRRRRITIHTLCAIIFLAGIVAAFHFTRQYVDKKVAFSTQPPTIVLANRPVWMTDLLAEQIIRSVKPAGTYSAFDAQMLADRVAILKANPWIKEVKQVRRVYGNAPGDTIEIDCDYRAPIALIHWGEYFWLIDGDGVRLPEQFTVQHIKSIVYGQDKKLNIRIIEGVSKPPVEAGHKWPGEDLAAAIDMVKLLYGQPYAEEIVKIDVGNFEGRNDMKDPQIALVTKYNTTIRWGEPLNLKFFVEAPPAVKLERLQEIYKQYGQVDAKQPWIDIRGEVVTKPIPGTEHADSVH